MANFSFSTTPEHIAYLDYSSGEYNIKFVLLENVIINWDIKGINNSVIIEKGFYTNFASVPFIFRNIIPNIGGHNSVALLHDYLYRNHYTNRKVADYILREGCKLKGISIIKCWIIWVSVRMFGWKHWA